MKYIFMVTAIVLSSVMVACSNNQNKQESKNVSKQVSEDSNEAAAPANQSSVLLPSFTIEDVNGNAVNVQSLKGKKIFINLWASWCPPCRQEIPSIVKLSKSIDQNKVAFVMLSLDKTFDKAKDFARSQNLSLPIYYPAENLPLLFNVDAIPTTFIFDEKGNLIRRTDGGDDYNTQEYRQLLQ